MRDSASMFLSTSEYNIYSYSAGFMILSELLIWFFTSGGFTRNRKHHSMDITMWFVITAWCGSFLISYYFRDEDVSIEIRNRLLPHFFYHIGILFILGGTVLRDLSVLTLRRAFTLNVQTTENQHLIQTGLYRFVRNPAYTGSILSLLGISFALRSIYSPVIVLLLCLLCYSVRIKKEESELSIRFGEEFQKYKKRTWRLIPYIY